MTGEIKLPNALGGRSTDVISGYDRGLIRPAPEQIGRLFTQSLTENLVFADPMQDVAERIIGLGSAFGHTEVTDRRPVRWAQEYKTNIFFDLDDQSARLTIDGPIPGTHSAATSLAEVFPRPQVDLTFTRRPLGTTLEETHRFRFGRGGVAMFEHSESTFDENNREHLKQAAIPADAAREYILEHLPAVVRGAGQLALSHGVCFVPHSSISGAFNMVRLERLGSGGPRPSSESLYYLPADQFEAGHREGEFFALDCPENQLPADALDYSCLDDRLQRIAQTLPTVNAEALNDTAILLEGLPMGFSRAAVMKHREGASAVPDTIPLPTNLFDRAAAYLLQNPELVQGSVDAYQHMHEVLGEEPLSASHLSTAIQEGLLPGFNTQSKMLFYNLASMGVHLDGGDRTAPALVAAMDRTYDQLVQSGQALRPLYTPAELDSLKKSRY